MKRLTKPVTVRFTAAEFAAIKRERLKGERPSEAVRRLVRLARTLLAAEAKK